MEEERPTRSIEVHKDHSEETRTGLTEAGYQIVNEEEFKEKEKDREGKEVEVDKVRFKVAYEKKPQPRRIIQKAPSREVTYEGPEFGLAQWTMAGYQIIALRRGSGGSVSAVLRSGGISNANPLFPMPVQIQPGTIDTEES